MRTKVTKNIIPLKTIEPTTTLIDDEKFLRILTELPDIAEERIKIDLENMSTSITIHATDSNKQYKTSISVPYDVRFCKKRFSDGVLELTLEKNKS